MDGVSTVRKRDDVLHAEEVGELSFEFVHVALKNKAAPSRGFDQNLPEII